MHTEWYLHDDNIAYWKCRACDTPRRWDTYLKTTNKWEGKALWFGHPICYRCHGVLYRHAWGTGSGTVLQVIVIIAIVIDRSCAASIITRSSWYGFVITRVAPRCVGVTVISIGRYHPYGLVISSVVDVMGFDVLRASVGCVHPGAAM